MRQTARSKIPPIRQIASELVARSEAGQRGATVFLGAGASISSGIPPWSELAARICTEFDIPTGDLDPITALADDLGRPDVPYARRYTLFRSYLSRPSPSIGYAHVAQLVKDGLIDTVLTTNWDLLLERALLHVLPIERVKFLVRGEISDDDVASELKWRHDYAIVVKLHGDIQTRRFMLGDTETRRFSKHLTAELQERLGECTFIVGHSVEDIDVLSVLLSADRDRGVLYHVRHSSMPQTLDDVLRRSHAQVVTGEQPSVLAEDVRVNVGDFDIFFTQLDLAAQHQLIAKRRHHLRKAEKSILDKERTGVGYVNYTRITELVEHFALEVKKASPDLILFVDDPSAPGGMELHRRMLPLLKRDKVTSRTATIRIEGKSGSRTHRRSVTSDLALLNMPGTRTILILDAITFSGNTLLMARDAVRKAYPSALVTLGVLVISQQLFERQEHQAPPNEKILSQVVTDRHEIFFPWGVTQTTSTFERRFEGATEESHRHVKIAKRPWGTIEVLVDVEVSSVRLLTIEAGRKLSFQRHLCRDELFVALDDNIGLDICAEELDRSASEYDEHVRSLILEKGDYVLVPRGVWHRTKASMDRVRLLEVAFGLYDQDNDIERRWDDYERERVDGRI